MEEKVVSLKEIQSIATEGLKLLKSVCDKEGIVYFLAGGTLLGAKRHKGFIPWDDDVDILIFRSEYEKLMKLPPETFGKDWCLLSYESTEGYDNIFMKLVYRRTEKRPSPFESGFAYGISIDVFPLDSLDVKSDAEAEKVAAAFRKDRKKIERWFRPLITKRKGNLTNILRKIYHLQYLLMKHFSSIADQYHKLEKKYVSYSEDSAYVLCYLDTYKKIWRRTDFISKDKEMRNEIFENEYYNVPAESEKILSVKYGNDYMDLPPESKRVTDHKFTAYYIDAK